MNSDRRTCDRVGTTSKIAKAIAFNSEAPLPAVMLDDSGERYEPNGY